MNLLLYHVSFPFFVSYGGIDLLQYNHFQNDKF